jgi:prepilin-type N-terminal cleavage/methylation domain-containing protein
MPTSRAKRGFTLVEVLLSLGVFAVLFSGALAVMVGEKKLERWNRETGRNTAFLEALREVMAEEVSYDELLELERTGRVYVAGEDMDLDMLLSEGSSGMFSNSEPETGSFITLHVTGGAVLEAELKLHQQVGGREELVSTKFYKGSFRRQR